MAFMVCEHFGRRRYLLTKQGKHRFEIDFHCILAILFLGRMAALSILGLSSSCLRDNSLAIA
jgi:hypothetical protein